MYGCIGMGRTLYDATIRLFDLRRVLGGLLCEHTPLLKGKQVTLAQDRQVLKIHVVASCMYLPACLQTFFLLPCLSLLLALLLFRQLSLVEASQKFPRLRRHAHGTTVKIERYAHLRASSSNTTALTCLDFCRFFAFTTL
jgi:hypothetical protein